jgi:inner membrane transporter RhtA
MTTTTHKAGEPQVASLVIPIVALLGAIVSVQFGASLAKGLFPVVGAEGTTALRLVTGALILGIVMRPWRVRLNRRILPALIGYGVTLAAMNLLFYLALRTIPLGIAVSLEFTGPLAVATLSSRRRIDFLWIGLAVAGILLLSPPVHTEHPIDPLGAACALGAGASWALYILFGQKAGGELGHQTTALGMTLAAILVLPVGLAHAGAALFQPPILLSALAVGLFSSAVPFSLEMVALTRMPARVYGTLTSLEPAFGALMGMILLQEMLTLSQWVGIAVVVAAALGAAVTMRKPAATPEQVG